MAKILIIVIDGLHRDAIDTLGPSLAPNLWSFKTDGVTTDKAISLYGYTVTTPCNCSILTCRPVENTGMMDKYQGHGWTENISNFPWLQYETTIHQNKGSYVPSIFDVAFDAGLTTALYGGKGRYQLFAESWANKLSYSYITDHNDPALITNFVTNEQCDLTLLHTGLPDQMGHESPEGWSLNLSSPYMTALKNTDTEIGRVLSNISSDTTILLTSDHGGKLGTRDHSDPNHIDNFRVAFYAKGPLITSAPGTDLFLVNPSRIVYDTNMKYQVKTGRNGGTPLMKSTIRNAEIGNLALRLLGLEKVPGSMFDGSLVI